MPRPSFLYGEIGNDNTRAAYRFAVERFLGWCESRGVELQQITPKMIREYLDRLAFRRRPSKKNPLGGPGVKASIPTQKQHLAALRHFFDVQVQVTRHAILLNPALSVRGPRYQAREGKTPEITPDEARLVRDSVDTATVVGLRDRAIYYNAHLYRTAGKCSREAPPRRSLSRRRPVEPAFLGQGGKVMDIPVRHDLEQWLGHADPRTTQLYDRTQKRVTRNLVERISI